jgi:DsbC/DsbD-like thiol-disulfide interchange protein
MTMRKTICTLGLFLIVLLSAQSQVNWQYSAKKISDGTYEVHVTAKLADGWHIYAQNQPSDAIATPTKIEFLRNPLMILKGDVKEVGNVQKFKDPTLGIEQLQYADKVDFVQVVKVKGKIKTNLSGSTTFQICTNEKCLPPTTTKFSIALEG